MKGEKMSGPAAGKSLGGGAPPAGGSAPDKAKQRARSAKERLTGERRKVEFVPRQSRLGHLFEDVAKTPIPGTPEESDFVKLVALRLYGRRLRERPNQRQLLEFHRAYEALEDNGAVFQDPIRKGRAADSAEQMNYAMGRFVEGVQMYLRFSKLPEEERRERLKSSGNWFNRLLAGYQMKPSEFPTDHEGIRKELVGRVLAPLVRALVLESEDFKGKDVVSVRMNFSKGSDGRTASLDEIVISTSGSDRPYVLERSDTLHQKIDEIARQFSTPIAQLGISSIMSRGPNSIQLDTSNAGSRKPTDGLRVERKVEQERPEGGPDSAAASAEMLKEMEDMAEDVQAYFLQFSAAEQHARSSNEMEKAEKIREVVARLKSLHDRLTRESKREYAAVKEAEHLLDEIDNAYNK